MNDDAILDGLQPVCLCKGLRKALFLRHIAAGRRTVEELARVTGAGTGSCCGKRCLPRIAELLRSVR